MMKKLLCLFLVLVMCLGLLTACSGGTNGGNGTNDFNDFSDVNGAGSDSGNDGNSGDDGSGGSGGEGQLVYAVEAGSAGEEVALANGFEIVSVETQSMALMEVQAGTADAAVIDLLMAGAMVGEGTSYPDLKVSDQKLNSEMYGVGCRKGSDLASYINAVMAEAYADGTMEELAVTYGVQEALLPQDAAEFTASESDSDVAYIQGKGKLIVGITEFEPMDYTDENGEWIGFDADMAKLVAEKLGVEIEFIVIEWDNKVFELNGKTIDVVWNGMTLTDAVQEAMECTNAYCENAQVVITK